jgi:hypothetical protein
MPEHTSSRGEFRSAHQTEHPRQEPIPIGSNAAGWLHRSQAGFLVIVYFNDNWGRFGGFDAAGGGAVI